MATFEIQVSGTIIVEADTIDEALEEAENSLGTVLTSWEVAGAI
jgi:hypothetical protein